MDEKMQQVVRLCIDQARGFITAAGRLSADSSFTHIVYHLALLALEEIGKAGMIRAQSVTRHRLDGSWIDKSLDNHVRKLLWALWSPIERIDPKDFEEARELAERFHARRVSALYVDVGAGSAKVSPNELITANEASATLSLAQTRLELEESRGVPDGTHNDLMEWFLDTMADDQRRQQLLSRPFVARYEEFGGDVRSWIKWAREEFVRREREVKELLQAELARGVVARSKSKPRWQAMLTVYTPSHSLRPKVLKRWNERIKFVELLWSGKKDQFTLRVNLNDDKSIAEFPGLATSLAKVSIACLNIGSIGYFWFQRPGFEQRWFEELRDLEKPEMLVALRKSQSFWDDGRAVALTEEHIDHATHCMLAFAPLSEQDAEPIFRPYFDGLAFIAKSDIFYSLDELARRAFTTSLGGALRRYGEWNGAPESFRERFDAAFSPFMPNADDRDRVFLALTPKGDPDDTSLTNLRTAKHLADLYLIHVARNEWRRAVDTIARGERPPKS
jgi:AbiV family abortive infection protein